MKIYDETIRSDVAEKMERWLDGFYFRNDDRWCGETCSYEIDKRADTLSFLYASYQRACEIGCSNGALTEQLAPRCRELIAVDSAEAAAMQARARLAQWPQVDIRLMQLPHQDLEGQFDLLVLSEMLYRLSVPELADMAALATRRVTPGGDLIIVSHDGETQTQLTGRQATDLFLAGCGDAFQILRAQQREGYHVRLLQRRQVAA